MNKNFNQDFNHKFNQEKVLKRLDNALEFFLLTSSSLSNDNFNQFLLSQSEGEPINITPDKRYTDCDWIIGRENHDFGDISLLGYFLSLFFRVDDKLSVEDHFGLIHDLKHKTLHYHRRYTRVLEEVNGVLIPHILREGNPSDEGMTIRIIPGGFALLHILSKKTKEETKIISIEDIEIIKTQDCWVTPDNKIVWFDQERIEFPASSDYFPKGYTFYLTISRFTHNTRIEFYGELTSDTKHKIRKPYRKFTNQYFDENRNELIYEGLEAMYKFICF